MAWLNQLNSSFVGKRCFLLAAALLAALVASGCNVGKTDTTAATTTGATTTPPPQPRLMAKVARAHT